LDFAHYLFRFACIAQIIHDHAESVLGKPLRDGTADSTGCSGYNRYLLHAVLLCTLAVLLDRVPSSEGNFALADK
jgi:hypothetical protein